MLQEADVFRRIAGDRHEPAEARRQQAPCSRCTVRSRRPSSGSAPAGPACRLGTPQAEQPTRPGMPGSPPPPPRPAPSFSLAPPSPRAFRLWSWRRGRSGEGEELLLFQFTIIVITTNRVKGNFSLKYVNHRHFRAKSCRDADTHPASVGRSSPAIAGGIPPLSTSDIIAGCLTTVATVSLAERISSRSTYWTGTPTCW
jgi:hypothetical protein